MQEEELRQRHSLAQLSVRQSTDTVPAPPLLQPRPSVDLGGLGRFRERREAASAQEHVQSQLSLDLSRVRPLLAIEDSILTSTDGGSDLLVDPMDSVRSPLLGSTSLPSDSSFLTKLSQERQSFVDTLEAELKKVSGFVARMKRTLQAEATALKRSAASCSTAVRLWVHAVSIAPALHSLIALSVSSINHSGVV
jgi:hypothetical protein